MGLGTPQPGRLGDQLPTLVGLCFRAHGSAGGHNRPWAHWAPSAGCGSQAALNALTMDGRKQDHVTGHAHQWKTRLGPVWVPTFPAPAHATARPAALREMAAGQKASRRASALQLPGSPRAQKTVTRSQEPTHGAGTRTAWRGAGGYRTPPLGWVRKAGVPPQGCTDSVWNGQAPHGLRARRKIKS